MVPWLGLFAFTAKGMGSIPGRGTKILQATSWSVSLVTQSCPTLCDPMDCSTPGFPVNHQLPELTQISSSIVPFSSGLQSFPASGCFPMSQFFTLSGQSIGVSASPSVLPILGDQTQDCSPLGWTGWMSLQYKGLSRVFSNTTLQKHQFFGAQLSL